MASRISLSTSFSGRWSLISWCVRKPRVLPILMSVFSSWRRLATSSSVSAVSSRPNSRISARSLARETFMRSGLALTLVSPSSAASTSGSPSSSASRSEKSSSARLLPSRPCVGLALAARLALGRGACDGLGRGLAAAWRAFSATACGLGHRGLGCLSSTSAAWRGLAAFAALAGAALFFAVMQILGWWWASDGRSLDRDRQRTGVRSPMRKRSRPRCERRSGQRADSSASGGQAGVNILEGAALAGEGWPCEGTLGQRVAGARRCCCHSCRAYVSL